jgi:hypothetical protein
VAAKKPETERQKMEREIRESLPELDDEGVLFLLRQAQVLIHNARVDRMAREKHDEEEPGTPRPRKTSANAVQIEESAPGASSLFLTIGKARKILTTEEMKQLVRICYAAETKSDALRQLFTVLARERKDILGDAGIGSPSHPLMEALFTTIRSTYTLKDR